MGVFKPHAPLDGTRGSSDFHKENWTEFQKFVEANASSQDKVYLDELLAIVDKDIANSEPNRYFGGSTLIDYAYNLIRNAEESLKQDDLRKSGFQERDQSNIKNRIKYLNNSFDYISSQVSLLPDVLSLRLRTRILP